MTEPLASRSLGDLMAEAAGLRDAAHGRIISYSRKVFIPLTQLCRDVCHYCTFAQVPRQQHKPYLLPEDVLTIARAGAKAGCTEALFTLGDKPELRWPQAREALAALGYSSTIDYLTAMCALVYRETGLLPHANPGVMLEHEIAQLRTVTASQGMMLESSSARLCERDQVHFGSPDKHPEVRLEALRAAGRQSVPTTTGILIGIGETREERLQSLRAIADLHARHGHIQEVIIQNFRAKPGTRLARGPEPGLEELLWTLSVARLTLGGAMNIQAPPNLSPGVFHRLVEAGLNDWGGVSPVTPDHVNPEAPWPQLDMLAERTAAQGKVLVQRLPLYPSYVHDADRWLAPEMSKAVRRSSDSAGFARADRWSPGDMVLPTLPQRVFLAKADHAITRSTERAASGERLDSASIDRLFSARDADLAHVLAAADTLRQAVCGDDVHYVVNRNINYTNICSHHCTFCAFSKGRSNADLRGPAYDLDMSEIVRRAREARARGATEVCLQGGIHPAYTGHTYEGICQAVKAAEPSLHVHAFSPLEILHGARTLGLALPDYLQRLQGAGLASLPGTAAEILDDEVRREICPDKLNTAEWLNVMHCAHTAGLRTTATIMFGHVERVSHWSSHLLALRDLQQETKGFTEFVPLPFVAMEAPMYRRGRARRGPTFREALLMHAVPRLVLHPHFSHVQTSWVKMGRVGVAYALRAGADDLGGTLMNESISRAAGTLHGQELPPLEMEALIRSVGRTPRQRTTLYGAPPEAAVHASRSADPLLPVIQTPPRRRTVSIVEHNA